MPTKTEELWYGNIAPLEEPMRQQERVKSLFSLLDRHRKTLWDCLNEDGREVFVKYEDACRELSNVENEDAFTKGFSLGARLIAEAFLTK